VLVVDWGRLPKWLPVCDDCVDNDYHHHYKLLFTSVGKTLSESPEAPTWLQLGYRFKMSAPFRLAILYWSMALSLRMLLLIKINALVSQHSQLNHFAHFNNNRD